MGYFVDRLEKKLKGDDDKELLVALFIGSFVLGLATPWIAFDNHSSGGVISLIAVLGSMAFISLGIISLLSAIYEVQADAQEFVEAYKRDYPSEPEISLLEAGYKKANEYQSKAFKDALTAWLGLGVYIGLVELVLFAIQLKKSDKAEISIKI